MHGGGEGATCKGLWQDRGSLPSSLSRIELLPRSSRASFMLEGYSQTCLSYTVLDNFRETISLKKIKISVKNPCLCFRLPFTHSSPAFSLPNPPRKVNRDVALGGGEGGKLAS